ncbi:ribosomal small subunit pseudouridine synthase A [Marinobacter sp. JH2]|uniref:pseudouridine synthase n=1 Tax=Marinobacter sp. AL4B TaxID=2871173 RepID=UPI001056B14F|nr:MULTISPECIES: pseudouridine synthase [unclassified Marinobacter]MBZ0335086.1 pseudouridine synthase [Marinobacter sp. AL4B]QBM18907.1 ribosomal small subunit pseudouridine synthase A [Marinobacter sp. JH2]
MRLDQYLATSTELSRKDAKKAITKGRVRVDGTVVQSANMQTSNEAVVELDGSELHLPGEIYLMMNKPDGVISATNDSSQPTAVDLLPSQLASKVHIAGRLDKDTTGLLLLTSDGQWSHQVTSPRRDCPKTYQVLLAEPLSSEAKVKLETGVLLKDEEKLTLPATVVMCSDSKIELTINEGRYHQVKRMLAATGNHVKGLHRLQIGEITLDPALEPGQYRELTEEELRSIAR